MLAERYEFLALLAVMLGRALGDKSDLDWADFTAWASGGKRTLTISLPRFRISRELSLCGENLLQTRNQRSVLMLRPKGRQHRELRDGSKQKQLKLERRLRTSRGS